MADTRRDKRAPVSLKVRFKSATVDEFIEQYAEDISRGGIFIKSKSPMAVGTLLKFEFQLKDESRLIHGVGRVVWKRDGDEAGDGSPPGMGIKFIKMDPESRGLVESIVTTRGDEEGQFEAGKDPRKRPPKKKTEPFFPAAPSAEDLPAPEDSTQVRHASEFLASALAGGGADEAAAAEAAQKAEQARKRTEEIQREREEEAARKKADVSDEERAEREARGRARAEKKAAEKAKAAEEFASTTSEDADEDVDLDAMLDEAVAEATSVRPEERADVERQAAAEAETVEKVQAAEEKKQPVVVAAKPKDSSPPPAKPVAKAPAADDEEGGTSPLLIVGAVAVLAVVGYFVWANVIAPGGDEPAPAPVAAEPEEELPVEEELPIEEELPVEEEVVVAEPDPDQPRVSVSVGSNPAGATILVNGREAGTTPAEVELPIGELVTVAVRLAGHREASMDVTAAEEGQDPIRFRLEAMDYVIEVQTTPEGARVVAAGRRTSTPGELRLPSAPSGPLRVTASKPGFERAVQTVDPAGFQERDGRMVLALAMTLTERERPSPTAMMRTTPTTMDTSMATTMETAMETAMETTMADPPPTMDDPPPAMMTEPPPTMETGMDSLPDNPF